RYLMEKIVGVDRRRTLPQFARKRLRSRLKVLGPGSGAAGKLVFFPDIYADYNDPELGVRAIKVLESLGYRVEVPELKWSGMPYVSYGEIEKATEVSIFNLRILDRYVNEGYTVVSTEPTAIYMLREVYGKLVPGQSTVKIGENSHSFFELIEKDLGKLSLRPVFTTNETIGFHIPCHERALSSGVPAINFLKSVGYKVQVLENGTCCGMAGTFGMKHGDLGYELSVAVGDRLFRLFKESGVRTIATESSVCAMQLFDGVGIQVIHPLYAVEFQ
ncbi:MAG: hypothetical protein HYW93_07255, partial [Thaumarchaeota archaeon]|nr:hypothetical protein [Nitrososphaerota archaeon]